MLIFLKNLNSSQISRCVNEKEKRLGKQSVDAFWTGMSDFVIRQEVEKDWRAVEEMVKEAFWNLYCPGADEHFILNRLRRDPSFIPSLSLVATHTVTDEVVGSIAFSLAHIVHDDPRRERTPILTFGPLAVSPSHQKQGIGGMLVRRGMELATSLGFSHIVIHGDPRYYYRFGFRTAEVFGIRSTDGNFAYCCLAVALSQNGSEWNAMKGRFVASPLFDALDPKEVEDFDSSFPKKEKKDNMESQKVFQILLSLRYP